MKKGLFLSIGGVILICAIFLISYYSYTFFNSKKPKVTINTLEIVLDDEGSVNLTNQSPTNDSDGNTIIPYVFTIKNKGDYKSKYDLLIEDYVTDTKTGLLDRKFLNYELKLNGNVIKTDNLGNIKNNILDSREINMNNENKYELRIWVKVDVSSNDWVGKTYNYNIAVNPKAE